MKIRPGVDAILIVRETGVMPIREIENMMQVRIISLALLTAVIFDTGCVSVDTPPPAAGERYSPSPQVNDGSAIIYIHNDCDPSQYIVNDHVFLDGKEFSFLGYEAYSKATLAPGQHKIRVNIGSNWSNTSSWTNSSKPDEIEKVFEASPGKTYYFGIVSTDKPIVGLSMYGMIPIPSESNVKHNYKNEIIQEDNDKKLHDCGIVQPVTTYTQNIGTSK